MKFCLLTVARVVDQAVVLGVAVGQEQRLFGDARSTGRKFLGKRTLGHVVQVLFVDALQEAHNVARDFPTSLRQRLVQQGGGELKIERLFMFGQILHERTPFSTSF